MKKLAFAFIAMLAMVSVASCDDTETYAEQRDRENAAIRRFIKENGIDVITEAEFKAQDSTTNVGGDDKSKDNEFVLMKTSGVYMQIVRKGNGEPIKNGQTSTVLCRFTERNILTDSIQLTNNILSFASIPCPMATTSTDSAESMS